MRFFKLLKPWFLGLLCIHIWIYCTTHRALPSGGMPMMTVMYLFLSACLIAIILVARKRPVAATSPHRVLDLAAGVCMGLSSCFLALPLGLPPAVTTFVGSALGGVGVAWTYCRWGQFYAKLDMRFAAPLIFASMALGSAGKCLVDLLPPLAATCVLVCMPLLAYVCLYRSLATTPEFPEPSIYFNNRTMRSLVRLIGGVIVFSLTVGVVQSMPRNVVPVPLNIYPFVIHGGEILFAVGLFVWTVSLKHKLNFSRVWSLILLLMITALMFAPYFSETVGGYLYEFIGIAQTALIIVLYLGLADIARHSTRSPMEVFAAGWFAYTFPFAVGDILGSSLQSFEPYGYVILLGTEWVLVIATLFLLNDSAIGQHLMFTELNDENDEESPAMRIMAVQRSMEEQRAGNSVDEVTAGCEKLAREHGLTPREEEILGLLARGRSRAYIADAFVISENTVHGHVKRIYTKLDVHTKQELIDLVTK